MSADDDQKGTLGGFLGPPATTELGEAQLRQRVERLRAVFGAPALARLRRRVRARLLRGAELGSLTISDAAPEERTALDRLTGRVSRGRSLRVDLHAIETTLREAGLCSDLRAAIEALDGPLEDARALRAAEQEEWRRVFERARASLPPEPHLAGWLADLELTGLLKRAACGDTEEAEGLLDRACAVLRRLPTEAVPLAELAVQTTGDTHALDSGEPLSALVLRAIARIGKVSSPDDAESRREAWASMGVLCDELSAPVLVLNLRARSSSITERALDLHADAGEPYRVSTRQLVRAPFALGAPGAPVFICENPTIVAIAADRLGPRSFPLVCTEGSPKTAFVSLAKRLVASGASLRYHGDFDWPGVQIANLVIRRFGAAPWRLAPEDYLGAPPGPALEGVPVDASWSHDLTTAMRERGCAVHEEQVVGDLLDDLAR